MLVPFSPYISITDFTDRTQTKRMYSKFIDIRGEKILHKLGIGVMMSRKTLLGEPTKWANAFPPKEKIASIFMPAPFAVNVLHYADYDEMDFFNCLTAAIGWCGGNIEAVQLDMIWPDPTAIANAIHASRRNISVILQVGRRCITESADDPIKVVRRLEDYKGIIDGVLFDQSMGEGRLMDANRLLPYLTLAGGHFPFWNLVVAGGLGPDTISEVEPIVKELPHISIDAQGRLRPSHNALDPINWGMAAEYLIEAVDLFAKYQ
jgi:hypothetical protein